MARINLLPWRDEYRQERKKEFFSVLVLVCILALAAGYAWVAWVNGTIENQNARNAMLKSEIAQLNEQVKEIEQLKKRREELLARMKVIQDLQGTRPLIVRYFDEMVRSVPDGVFFSSLNRAGNTFSMNGITESNNRVSTLMRNLDNSDWYTAPNLKSVVASPQNGEQASRFSMSVNTAAPNDKGGA